MHKTVYQYVRKYLTTTQQNLIKRVSEEELFQLIMTRPPYFALQNMKLDKHNNIFTAEVVPEQSLGAEVGPISTSEAGRHLAISGLCHIALNKKVKNYYLVEQALVKRSNYIGIDKRFKITTKIITLEDRKASLLTTLSTASNLLIYEFSIFVLEQWMVFLWCTKIPPLNHIF